MPLPSHTQLMLPLLQTLKDKGGAARPKDLYDEIADQFNLSDEDRNGTVNVGQRKVNAFERRVRWTRQTAVLRGLISKDEPSVWRLTETANAKLGNIVRGSILTFAISENGAFLWANAEDAVGMIEKRSIQCIISSPPYPLLCPKAYGNILTLPSECVALSWAGLEDFISPRGRRGGGNVGIGFIDFQGLWEGRETAPSFSSLSMNRHFHGLPRSA